MDTANCIVCKAPATHWSGHVTDSKGYRLMAGWCAQHTFDAHYAAPPPGKSRGWCGLWTPKMGLAGMRAKPRPGMSPELRQAIETRGYRGQPCVR